MKKIDPHNSVNDLFNQIFGTSLVAKQEKVRMVIDPVIQSLQERVDDMNTEINDLREGGSILTEMVDRLTLQNQELKSKLDQEQAARSKQTDLTQKCNLLEGDIITLKEDLARSESNRHHAMLHISQQEAFLNEAKKLINELRARVETLEPHRINAEHLARKSIQLNDENARLKADYVSLMENFNQIKESVADLIEENNKFREQTTRLVADKSQMVCPGSELKEAGPRCGKCLSCQLEQAKAVIIQTSRNLEDRNAERDTLRKRVSELSKETDSRLRNIMKLSTAIEHNNNLYRMLLGAVNEIADHGIFPSKKRDIAAQALLDRNAYIRNHNVEGQL